MYRGFKGFFVAAVGVWISCLNLSADTLLSVQSTAGAPGTTAVVALNYLSDTNAPSLHFDLLYPTNDLVLGRPVRGEALSDHLLAWLEVMPGLRQVAIVSLSNSPLSNGVVAYMPFSISTNAVDHDEILSLSNILVSNAMAQVVPSEGSNGVLAVAVPPNFSAIFLTNGGVIHLELSGTTGRNYAIQSTTNLSLPSWTTLFTNTNAGGILKFDDVAVPGVSSRYYRAVVVP